MIPLRHLGHNFVRFLSQNLPSVLFILICNAVVLLVWNYSAYAADSFTWFLSKFFKSIFSTILLELIFLHLVFTIFSPKLQRYALSFFCVLSAVLLLIEGFLVHFYHSLITPYVIDALMQTNFQETKEFLLTFIDFKALFAALMLGCLSFLYFRLTPKIQPSPNTKWSSIFFGFYALIALIFVADISTRALKHKKEPFEKLNTNSFTRVLYSLSQYYGSESFYTNYKHLVANYQTIRNHYQDRITKSAISPKHIVLIIGESTQRNFLNAYGYKLQTTPHLNTLINNGGGGHNTL